MNWIKQSADTPAFPDILWSKPENRRGAGKLLIIGGHQQSFNAVSQAYSAALAAGAGTVRVILPSKLERMLSKVFPEAEFAPSTPIGSFGRKALDTLLEAASWSDAVLLAGDFGHNSETAILLESFCQKYSGKLTLAGDSTDYFLDHSDVINNRDVTLVIANLSQLQKLASPFLIQQNADFIKIIEQIGDWSNQIKALALTIASNKVIVGSAGRISTTPIDTSKPNEDIAAYAAVWWLQQPQNAFETLTTSIYAWKGSMS